ncbi:polysaccharide deacetylase family protein [Alicyclobacillus macrosporangiidus]|uniref:polysaccharide deacetylase family protein n=1 Tax=Alicyclobacillus macrosporangiidus TaxID=392015 RepID=UPI000A718F5A|nr:polysaccharide deacetylase family protein [Alicyclobacillus macrosporangiidus]
MGTDSRAMPELVQVAADEHGPYLVVRVTLDGRQWTIRWGIDQFTYDGFRQRVVPFMHSHSSRRPTVWLFYESAEDAVTGGMAAGDPPLQTRVLVHVHGWISEISVPCSTLFVSNLRWLVCVASADELAPLVWENPDGRKPPPATGQSDGHATGDATERNPAGPRDGEANQRGGVSGPRRKGLAQAGLEGRRWTGAAAVVGAGIAAAALWSFVVHPHVPQGLAVHAISSSDRLWGLSHPVENRTVGAQSGGVVPADASSDKGAGNVTNPVTVNPPPEGQHDSGSDANVPGESGQHGKAVTLAPGDASSGDVSPDNAPTETQDPRAPAQGKGQAPSPAALFSVPKGCVALTFDDGPSQYTKQIVDILSRYHVHATFFFVGNRISMWPEGARAVVEAGDVIGNHSMSHPLLTHLSATAQARQIAQCEAAIESATGLSAKLFRPPYGAYDKATEDALATSHMTLALWNRDPRDWAAKSAAEIVANVLNSDPSGGVYDMHETRLTVEALPAIIEGLQKKHLRLVAIG